MDIVISYASDKPIYLQIADQLASQILNGELKSGECLPPIRTVAAQLHISVITVKKAWEELGRQGFLETVTGKGCFVAPLPSLSLEQKRDALAEEQFKKDMAYYRTLGLSREELVRLVERWYDQQD